MNPAQAGIKFYVESSKFWASAEDGSLMKNEPRFRGEITLTTHFDRTDLWDAIVQRLNGLAVHKGGDIQSQLIEILQGKVDLLEKELESRGTDDRQRAQRAEQEASFAKSEAQRLRNQVELLQSQAQMKQRELEEAMKANAAWQEWHRVHQALCHPAG